MGWRAMGGGRSSLFWGFEDAILASISAFEGAGSVAGVSGTVLWVPVVQGGMDMNSSKVRTRGLQHFHPGQDCR